MVRNAKHARQIGKRQSKVKKFPWVLGVGGAALLGFVVIAGWLETGNAEGSEITVYKSPMCGCCNQWVDHLRDHGFEVKVINRTDLEGIKVQHGITQELASCHTALIGDYAVEGHVPTDVIKRLLKERPSVKGIAVPGMPIGSPGMEGGDPQSYDILTFDADGQTAVYSSR